MISVLNSLQNDTSSLIFTNLLVQTATLTIHSSTSANFYLHIPPYLFTKPSSQSPLTLPFPLLQQFFTSLFSRTAIPAIPTQRAFSLPQPWEPSEDWLCFNHCIHSWNMDRKNRVHNHWFHIAQAQTISVLQVVVSEERTCNRNGKLSSLFLPYRYPIVITSIPY